MNDLLMHCTHAKTLRSALIEALDELTTETCATRRQSFF